MLRDYKHSRRPTHRSLLNAKLLRERYISCSCCSSDLHGRKPCALAHVPDSWHCDPVLPLAAAVGSCIRRYIKLLLFYVAEQPQWPWADSADHHNIPDSRHTPLPAHQELFSTARFTLEL